MTTPPRPRLVRPPSVQDYERMTQQARLSAARLMAEQIRQIEIRRAQLDGSARIKPAEDYTPAETLEIARFLLRRYQTTYADDPAVIVERQRALVAEAAGWSVTREAS